MKNITILLAEDSVGDQKLFQLALRHSVGINLKIVSDGVEALHYVRKEGMYVDAPQPDLIVLDSNLPKKHGFEVLSEMRCDATLTGIPVAVFTGAEPTKEMGDVCKFNANFYIIKPDNADRYFAIVQELENFCRSIIKFPDLKKIYSDELRRFMAVA